MYKFKKVRPTEVRGVTKTEGEPLEHKIQRMIKNKEPIKDGAPEIFTERKDGVLAGYNIRTDRFEVAAEAMDKVTGSIRAKRDSKAKTPDKEAKVVDLNKDSGAESTQGKAESK